MKKIIIGFSLTLFCWGNVITIDNKLPSIGDFTSILDAVNNCNNGDTLIIYPSQTSYGDFTFTKNVTIYGSGFFLEVDLKNSLFGSFTFDEGSDGSILKSMEGNYITINASDITIEKNKLKKIIVNDGQTGIIIKQNEVKTQQTRALEIYGSTAFVSNNIFSNPWTGGAANWNTVYVEGNVMFNHNLSMGCGGYVFNAVGTISAFNNIFICGQIYLPENPTFDYNVCGNDVCTGTNINDIDVNTQFENFTYDDIWLYYADESQFDLHLNDTSSLIGAGLDGVDIGIYGGNEPFSDMGISELPTIYNLKVHDFLNIQDSISVEFKMRSN